MTKYREKASNHSVLAFSLYTFFVIFNLIQKLPSTQRADGSVFCNWASLNQVAGSSGPDGVLLPSALKTGMRIAMQASFIRTQSQPLNRASSSL